ncbi:BcABA3 [Mycena haematopus]|nr:BcABA3 [Mycena haematopus]
MSQPPAKNPARGLVPHTRDTWYYPPEMADDLKDVDLPEDVKAEILSTTWECLRSGIPHHTNWTRYLAYARLIMITYVSEFMGKTVDVLASDNLLGHSVSSLLATLFKDTHFPDAMAREYRCAVLFMAEKASHRRDGELFRRFASSLAQSPRQWFRMRDCDGLVRFTIIAALACNDVLDVSFSEEQFEILCEILLTMYDAVAFYKHRAEGEVCNTFAYMPEDTRVKAFQQSREILWALDAAWARRPTLQLIPNLLRVWGGSAHMLMRRYRFVEEGLRIGVPETDDVVSQARINSKLWYCNDAHNTTDVDEESIQRYKDVIGRSEELLFPGLAEILEAENDMHCDTCLYPASYGAEAPMHCFGGVQLCDKCTPQWRDFLESLPDRAAKAFPELVGMYDKGISSTGVVPKAGQSRV